jgi:mannose-6-phosphate isomerase-like protein (cupin superfamily)
VIEGEGDFHPEVGKDVHVSAGTVIYNKKGECHGITNNTDKDLKFIGVIAPHPAEYVALP